MVRNYVRKTDRGSKYSRAHLIEAIGKIKSKEMNCYEAANHYKIPKTTLHDHVVGKRGKSFTLGKPPVLPNHVEKILAANLLEIETNGFNFSRKEKLELVGLYLRSNNIKTPFKRDVPGECWWTTFGKRHGLTSPTTKALLVDFGRPKERDVIVVKEYYSTLESKINELGLMDKPGQIWHIEEHSFCAGKRVANADKNKDVTVVTALSAEGKKAPLLTVLKGEESHEWLLGQQVLVSHSLGMCRDVFKDYFTTIFLNYIDDSRPSLVIYDGQTAHIDIDLINDARKAKISLIKSPSYLEGLGISVTNVLKQKWDETSSTSLEEFKTVVAGAFDKLEVFEIEEGFRTAGVHPFEAVCDSKFDGARLMVYDEFKEYRINHSLRDEPEQVIMEEDVDFQMSLKIEPEDSSTSFDIDVGSMFEPEATTVQEYSQELKQAMIAVKKGLTFIEISPLPEGLHNEQTPAVYSGVRKLNIQQENQLIIWLEDLGNAGFMVTEKYLADAVNNLITDFGRVPLKNKDRHLYKGFLKRHPKLANRIIKDVTEVTEDALKSRFDQMQKYIKERNLEDVLNDPRRIFNCGETTFQLNEENRAIEHNMIKVNANDLTVVVTTSADGNIQTPSVFFNFKGGNKESVVSWTKGDFFCDQIIDVFHPWLTDHEIPLPVILFVDYTTHINLQLLDFCKENRIILIASPDCRLQPLETVFRSLKQYWDKEQTVLQKLKKDDIAKELVCRINKGFSSEIINCFKMCGLYPFDLKIGYDKIGQTTQS